MRCRHRVSLFALRETSASPPLPLMIRESPEILCFEHYHAPLRLERVRHGTAPYDSTEQRDLPSWKLSHNQLVILEDLDAEHPQLLSAKLSKIPETQLIFFWTSSAFFTLVPPENNDGRHSTIVDSSGNAVGSTGTMVSDDWESDGSGRGRHEFVVLGSRRNQFSHPVLLVLQIEWRDAIAHRLNCGEIKEEAWERGTHTWNLFCSDSLSQLQWFTVLDEVVLLAFGIEKIGID